MHGTGVLDLVHVWDLVRAHYMILFDYNSSNSIFNVGGSKPTSIVEFLSACQEVIQKPVLVKLLPALTGQASILYADTTLLRQSVEWSQHFIDLKSSLQQAYKSANRK
jgi:UDP-glucose 4-epimerase